MSLLPRFPTGEFTSLFRLLDDYNDHLANRNAGLAVRSFAPRFDVRETKDAYHLEGELPGIDQKDIDIEFTDPHTLVVKGKVRARVRRPRGRAGQDRRRAVLGHRALHRRVQPHVQLPGAHRSGPRQGQSEEWHLGHQRAQDDGADGQEDNH